MIIKTTVNCKTSDVVVIVFEAIINECNKDPLA